MTTKTLMSTTHIEHGGASSLSDKDNGSATAAQRPAPALTFEIDVNRTHKNKEGYKKPYDFNRSFATETHTWESFLSDIVAQGWPYTFPHQKRDPSETGADARNVKTPKHGENFTSLQVITGDDDRGQAGVLDFWRNDPFFARYGAAIVESVNSKPGAEKCHVLFLLDKPIMDYELAREILRALWSKKHGLYGGVLDSSIDPTNVLYNAVGGNIHRLDNALPYEVMVREILMPYREKCQAAQEKREQERAAHQERLQAQRQAGASASDDTKRAWVQRAYAWMLENLSSATPGGGARHNQLLGFGGKVAGIEATTWAQPFLDITANAENDAITACRANGYYDDYANSDREVLRVYQDGRGLTGAGDMLDEPLARQWADPGNGRASGSGPPMPDAPPWPADDAPPVDASGSAGDIPPGDAPQGEPDFLERNADEINALLAELATIAAKRKADKEATKERGDDAPAFDLAVEYACQDPLEKLADIARGLKAGARSRLADKVKETGLIGKTDFLRDVRGDSGALGTGRLQAEPLTTAGYADLYKKWGYRFRLNLLNDELENGGAYFSDPEQDKLIAKVRDFGIEHADRLRVSVDHAREAITVTGLARAYHPVKDYLNALQWDGDDHISRLASHFTSNDDLFPVWFRHWICGSVARVLCGGFQTPMLVLGGLQDLGKSYFAEWICPLPRLFHPGKILTDNKDCSLRQASTFVWEVGEIGHTTRKADIDALKFFITREVVRDRKPYGRRDTVKPALANFIGTFNPDGAGFLVDQTGNRRFLTTNLSKIDWGYASLDVNQVWAQAVSIVQAGDGWKLTPEQTQDRDEQNKVHLISNPTREALASLYDFTGNPADATTADSILQTLHTRRGFQVTRVTAVQIGKALKAIEGELAPSGVVITRKRKTTGGVKRTVYHGVKACAPGPPDDDRPMYLD